jgi:hypothetical protein
VATVQAMEKEIGQWESALAGIHETREAARLHITDLERKRQELALAARVDKNSAAQKTLHEIETELVMAHREDGHDDAAVAEIEKKLQVLRPALALAKKLAQREQLRKFIASRADRDRPARIVKLVRDLEADLAGWTADKAAVAAALAQFDSRLDTVGRVLPAAFVEPVRIDYGTNQALETFGRGAVRVFDQALAAVEAHLLPGEPVPADRRAYRTKAGAHFDLHGLELRGGEVLYLLPEHAAYYVKEGLLIEEGEPGAQAEEAAAAPAAPPPAEGQGKRQIFV